jgi:hypothetical protein
MKHHIPNSYTSSPQVSTIERSHSPKSVTVLDAVQEYQRQHINVHQPGYKRFAHLGGAIHNNRPMNSNGNLPAKPRGIGSFISSNINNKPLLQTKQHIPPPPQPPVAVASNYVSSSPKTITRVNRKYFH